MKPDRFIGRELKREPSPMRRACAGVRQSRTAVSKIKGVTKMTEYNFFQDLFDTYQSMSVFMQLAWLVVPFVFAAVFFALILHHMRKVHEVSEQFPSEEAQIYKMMNEDLEARILASERDELK